MVVVVVVVVAISVVVVQVLAGADVCSSGAVPGMPGGGCW